MISRETILRGFPMKPLGEVAEFLDSRRRPITASERVPGPYPYYGANGQQDSVADYIFDEPLVLLAEDGGPFDQPDRGIAYAIKGKTWVNNHAHVLRPRDHAQLRYLVRVLENYDVTPWITGSTRAKLTKAGAFKIQIPLPPLAEQRRIAGILDAADALRAKRREALVQLDSLLQSTFLDMFGDPVTNPMGWEVQRLADVFWLQEGPGVRNWQFKESGIKLLNVSNILKSGELDLSKTDRHLSTDEVQEKYSHFLVDAGDLVIASSGISIDEDDLLRTRSAFVRGEHLPLCMNTSTVRFKATDGVSDLRFLQQWLQSHEFRRQITREVTGSAQKNFGPTHLKRLRITLPPLDLLRRFDAIVHSVEQQKTRQRAHLAELDTLFASLQSRAFRGDL